MKELKCKIHKFDKMMIYCRLLIMKIKALYT